ncbi:c-type cytochrome [Verrucomicrobium spinosum]|uniref:c-type cytochrome n=1 Tax=Verrucomicrobium spinosum TaxID=2736 RepID=UPI00155D909F|nr:c-type cytochrome [Verrucomicrobium spinosum]
MLTASDSPAPLLSAIIEALGNSGEVSALVSTFSSLQGAVRTQAFDQILQRPDATLAFLGSVKDGKITVTDLGPGNVARLRTHPNKAVAKQAAALLDTLSPQTKQKNEAIAALTPEVLKPGNVANGKLMFTAACAICHKLGDVGTRDVGPPLTGMGAHGPAELLVHIVDPNREVDPSFWQWNITTNKGETLVGVITSENAASVTLRSQTGDVEIPKRTSPTGKTPVAPSCRKVLRRSDRRSCGIFSPSSAAAVMPSSALWTWPRPTLPTHVEVSSTARRPPETQCSFPSSAM